MQSYQQNFMLKLLLDTMLSRSQKPSLDSETFLLNNALASFSFPFFPQMPQNSQISQNSQLSQQISQNSQIPQISPISQISQYSKDLSSNMSNFQLYMRSLFENAKASALSQKTDIFSLKKETFLLTKPPIPQSQITPLMPSTQKSLLNQKSPLLFLKEPQIKLEDTVKIEESIRVLPLKVNLAKSEALEYIQNILGYLVKSVGRIRGTKLKSEGERFHNNIESIKEIYEGLMNKFMISNKTKEEKIKYVLRKSFKFMKEKLMLQNGMSLDSENDATLKKQIEVLFFDHYFANSPETLSTKDFANFKDMIMPFRKNSQNKTMNSEFLKKIFSFEKFHSDYLMFLRNFKEIAGKDNREKQMKTAKKITDLMASRQYKEFSQKYFKRMPWLEIWIEEAETIAKRLIESLPKRINEEEILTKKICVENGAVEKKSRANSI